MDSVYLKTFLEVMHTGSFTKAAEKLCVTQSAVSRRIQFMETQYEYTLVDRSESLLKPTPQGRLVMEKAVKILEIERELCSGLSQFGEKRQFSFISTSTFSMIYLPDIMRKFMRSHPDLAELKFVSDVPDNIVKGLREGLYEIAVMEHCEDFDLGGFKTVSLPGDKIVFVVAPGFGIPPDAIQLEELFKHTLFGRKTGSCPRILLEKSLRRFEHSIQDFNQFVVVDDLDTLITCLIKGDGIGYISSDLVRPDVESGQLVEIRIPGFVHDRRRTLVFSPHSPDCSYIQDFAGQILDYFKSAGPGRSGLHKTP